ncbi:MAG: T9SS type A sorting domain-containing protein [Vicingaceae bacterium]|nr:T9SS type A sorting domain-containing protein [Vicingaceae bacterium]
MNYLYPFSSKNTTRLITACCCIFLILVAGFNTQAQTNPIPQSLPYAQDFDDTTFTFNLLPSELSFWTIAGAPASSLNDATLSMPNGDAVVAASSSALATGGCFRLSSTNNTQFYIQTSADTLNGTNQLALSVITTNLQDIKVSYDIAMINAQAKTVGVVLQYRIGTTGNWSTINQSIYAHNNLTRNTGQIDNFVELQLPQEVNDTNEVQLRWATFIGNEAGSFSGIGIDNIEITGSEKTIIGPITTCSEEEITYTFNNMPNNSPIVVAINLPPGVTAIDSAYLSSPYTNTTIVVDTSDISNPTYSFTTPATSFTLNYYVKANCETFDANTTNAVVTISDTINGTLNNTVMDTILINSPWIIFDNTASTNLTYNNAFINNNYFRTFAYKNTGEPFTGDLLFVDTIPNFNTAAIQFVSAVIDSVTSGTANIISSMSIVNDSIVQLKIRLTNFSTNSQFFIKEEIKLINCPNGTNNHSFFNAIYGCADDTLCQEVQPTEFKATTKKDANDKPILDYTLLTKGYPNCWKDAQERIIRINNNGLSAASEVQIRFIINDPSWPTNIITENSLDSFEIYSFDGVTKTPITFILDTFSINFSDFIRATTTTPLAAGDSLFFRYFEVINCIDSTDYDNHFNTNTGMHYEGFPWVNLNHPCNPTNFSSINGFPQNQYGWTLWNHDSKLQQTFFNYNGTMNGGDSANFEITSSNLFVASVNGSNTAGFIFNIDSSEIQIELQLDSGLGLVQDSLYLWGNIGGIPTAIYPDTIAYFLGLNPLIGAGDRIIAHFSIPDSFYVVALPQPHSNGIKYKPTTDYTDFFSSFKVKFRLEAFCEYLLAAGPSAIVQKFFFVPNKSCNPDCKIPLAKVEDAINIHCPSCLFPGWNLSAFDIQRTNFGFADNNNNNFPDAFPLQPADTNLVQLKNVMIRDTLKCTLIANTSDGDGALLFNNIGVDYIFAQLLLQNQRMGHLNFIGATGTFTNATGVHNLAIPDYAGVFPDTSSFFLDLSIDSLKIYAGDTTLTPFWINNDLTIHLNFEVKQNFEQPHFNIEAINSILFMAGTPFTGVMTKPDAFNFDIDSLTAMTDSMRSELAFWCTGYEGRYGAIGTDFNLTTPSVGHDASGTPNYYPCKNVIRYEMNTEVGSTVVPYLSNNQTAWNSFSYELRNLWMMDSININYPNGYVLDSVVVINSQLTSDGVGGNTVRSCYKWTSPAYHIYDMNDAIVNPTSATIYLARNLTQLTADVCNNSNDPRLRGWDEAKQYVILFILKNSVCDTLLSIQPLNNYPITTYWSDFPTATNGDTTIVQQTVSGAFTKPDAGLTTNINSFIQDAPNSDLMMNISVNTVPLPPSSSVDAQVNHAVAENTFLIIHSPSGNVVIDSIVAIPSNQRIFAINQINNDSLYGLGEVGFVWGAANFNVFANYNCANIELADSILIYTGWNCNGYPDSLQPLNTVCYLDSQWVKFNIIKPGLQASLTVPDTLNVCDTLHYDIKLTATGIGRLDSINVWLFDSTGAYTYIPGSGQLIFNGSTLVTPTGLDTLSFALSDTSLLANFEQDTAHFIFDILPDCSFYTSTDKVKIMITATNYCGNQLDTIIIEQRPLFTNLPLQDSLKVELFNDTISGCGDSATVMAVITNLGSNPTGANNSLTITLPTGFAWSSGIPFTNVNGLTYTFNINGGIAAGGTQTILFNTADTVGNGIYNMMAAVWVAQEVICSNDTCIIAQPLVAFLDTAQLVVTNRDLTLTASVVDVSCTGAQNGSIDITVTGGTAPYTYSWVNSASTGFGSNEDITNLSADTYTVTVTDATNCSVTVSFVVNEVNVPCGSSICTTRPTITLPTNSTSSTPIPNGSVVDVQGLFTITNNTTYTNVKFRMAAGARIAIDPNVTLTLNKCHLFSCTQLWEEITVTNGANLVVENYTIIEDARNAINWAFGGFVTIDRSIFNRNITGLQLASPVTITPNNIQISNTIFTCRNFPNTLYQTNFNNGSFATLKNNLFNNNTGLYPLGSVIAPAAPNTRSQHGILSIFVPATIGVTAVGKSTHNLFDYLDFGIKVYDANFTIINNQFANLTGYVTRGNNMRGVGVFAEFVKSSNLTMTIGGTNNKEKNVYKNCYRGANITNYKNINFINNELTNTVTSPSFPAFGNNTGRFGLAIFNTFTGQPPSLTSIYTITGNTINNNATGIFINTKFTQITGQNIQLQNNKIDVTGTNTYCNQGIWMQSLAGSNAVTGSVDVNNNTVRNCNRNALLFENVNNMLNIDINNELSVKFDPNTTIAKQVIRLNSCEGALVSNNTNIRTTNNSTIPTATNFNTAITGIYLNNCQASVVTCNTINFVDVGVLFDQPNSNSQFTTNKINKAQYGLVLANGAIIGQQGSATQPSGNEWGPNNANNITLNHTFTLNTSGANTNSPIFAKPNVGNSCTTGGFKTMPCSNGAAPFISANVYQLGSGLNTATGTAPNCTARFGDPLANAKGLLQQANQEPPSVGKFMKERQAFHLIKKDPTGALLADNDLNAFFTQQQTQTIGLISTTQDLIGNNDLATAQATNSSIAPGNVAEFNTRTVTAIWLNSVLDTNYVLTVADSTSLRTIGNICMQQGGDATVLARTLLGNLTQEGYDFTDCMDFPIGNNGNRLMGTTTSTNLILNGSIEDINWDTTGYAMYAPWEFPQSGNPDVWSSGSNLEGHQTAQQGTYYFGGLYYASDPSLPPNLNARGPVIAKTSVTLSSGVQYCLSYYISLADTNNCAVNRSDAYFSPTPMDPTLSSPPYLQFVQPHVQADSTVFYADKENWMRIEGNYTAAGGENYITFGNLHQDNRTDTLCNGSMSFSGFPNLKQSYYYMDNFVLEEITPANAGADTTINSGDSVLIGNNLDSASSYVWSPNVFINDVNTLNPLVSPTVTTTYYVTKTQCSVTTIDSVTVFVNPVGISELSNEDRVQLYPNPNNGTFTLSHNLSNSTYVLEVIDIMGKVVHQEKIIAQKQEINTKQLSKGLYFVNVKTATGKLVYTSKMSVAR